VNEIVVLRDLEDPSPAAATARALLDAR